MKSERIREPFVAFRSSVAAALFCVAIYCGLAGFSPMALGDEAIHRPRLPQLRHGLQGMQFIGSLAVEGETNPGEDVLTFKDGKFSSRTCLEYGFAPAPYWVPRDAGGLHFRAELQSPEHGMMAFEGTFDDKQLLASALWTKERWYWRIEQKFRFRGRPLGQSE